MWGRSNPPPARTQPYQPVPEPSRNSYSASQPPSAAAYGPSRRQPAGGPPEKQQYDGYGQPVSGGYEKRDLRSSNMDPYQHHGTSSPRAGRFKVKSSPLPELALTNDIIVNGRDFGNGTYGYINHQFPVRLRVDTTQNPNHPGESTIERGQIGCSAVQRQWMSLSAMGDEVDLESLDINSLGSNIYLGGVDLEVGFNNPRKTATETYDADDMARSFSRAYEGLVLSPGQILVWDYHGETIRMHVKSLHVVDLGTIKASGERPGAARSRKPSSANARTGHFGILIEQTDVGIMKMADSGIKIKASAKRAPPNAILAPNFKFEDMGIGGLDSEFGAIFRRAFASRVFPPGLVEKLGITHVKGILLYGPPGTGKTLMARQIGKMLNAREPKIVNGPEILNKYVGASEENIRKLFADAEKEYKEKGDESGLHIIIFDELDAICKQRGSTNNGTGVGDSVVNQLLSKLDGVDQLNNILVIGMTNRLDMIDEALLRPGRLEVHMEISLPDEKGRMQILNIHTAKMRQNHVLDRDVDLLELASLTKNFSGAEIAGLIKSASSFAFNRHVKVGTMAGISEDVENLRVKRDDFMQALEEVKPAFGVAEEELAQVVQNGIIHYDPVVDDILRDGRLFVEQVRTSTRTPLVSLLLHGPPGSGKTALAATIASLSDFPFIKLVSPDQMVGFSEGQKIAAISKVFMDSYKSPLSVIVVDSIERLLDWVAIGPRFSNGVLQTLLVLLGKRPPKDRRLLIIATTSQRPLLTECEMSDVFDSEIRVPPISSSTALEVVMRDAKLFSSETEYGRALAKIRQAGLAGEGRLNIGIKKLLSLVEMSRQEPEAVADRLVQALMQLSPGAIM